MPAQEQSPVKTHASQHFNVSDGIDNVGVVIDDGEQNEMMNGHKIEGKRSVNEMTGTITGQRIGFRTR